MPWKGMLMVKFWGREPALLLGLLAVAVKLASAFGLNVTAGQQALINAFAAAAVGLAVAMIAHDGVSAAVLGLTQAALALAVGFGLHWSADQQAVVMAFAQAVVAMWTRTQVTAPVAAVVPLKAVE